MQENPLPVSDHPKLTSTLIISSLIAALGGLLFGFDTAVISGANDQLKNQFQLNEKELGFTVAIAMLGTIIGSIGAGRPSNIWGRKVVLLVMAFFYFISALGCALAWDWYSLLFFRLLGGVAVGGASVVSPLYITEISPAYYRGRLVGIQQFNIVLGILLAFLSNYLIGLQSLGKEEWRWMLGVQMIPSILFFIFLFPIPESPRWLVMKNRLSDAKDVLTRIGVHSEKIETELEAIQKSLGNSSQDHHQSVLRWVYQKPLFLALMLAMFNQLSGINAVLYYAPTIFEKAGAGKDSSLLQAVAIGSINLLFTLLAMLVIDHLGRKKLMIIGSIGYITSLITTAGAFYWYRDGFTTFGSSLVLISLLVFIASHAVGQGAIIWVYIGEVFPNKVRAQGQSFGNSVHWIMATIITFIFPSFASYSPYLAFSFFALMMVFQLIWTLVLMPETKGIPLEQLQKHLGVDQ